MAETSVHVHLVFGDDQFAIDEFITRLIGAMGDPTLVEMNTTRLDGRNTTLDAFLGAISAVPFLAPHRLVILNSPIQMVKSQPQKERFKEMIGKIPDTSALVLVERQMLTEDRERAKNKQHWLEKWAADTHEHVEAKCFRLPHGAELARWIQARAKASGGQFTPQAANALAELVGVEPRILDQEITKILTYVNFSRPVEIDDVQHLTPSMARVQDFALVNALRTRNGKQALSVLRRELVEKDAIPIFQGIVYQFRLLLQTREILDHGGREEDVLRQLKTHPYVAKMAVEQARAFTMPALEKIYHRLLDVDTAIKTGGMDGDLALEVLVIELTQ